MEFQFEQGTALPHVDIADIIATPSWLMAFQEEMRYFSPEAIIEAKPDITAEKLARFDEHTPHLAGALNEPHLQTVVVTTLYDLQQVYPEKYAAGEADLAAVEAVNERVTSFVLAHTPSLAAIAFDERRDIHTTALEVLAHAASQYGHASYIPAHLHAHVGIYDRFRRSQNRAPQLHARNLLLHTPTQQQPLVATTLDALWQEGYDMSHEATIIADSTPYMAHQVHPELSHFIARVCAMPEPHHELVHAYLTAAQYVGRQSAAASLKPFAQFAAELRTDGPSKASHFWLAA